MKYCMFCMAQIDDHDNECPVCGKNQEITVSGHHLVPGTILNGRYYVGVSIGEGGFGITYIGRDLNLDMEVAIKEYYPSGYVFRSGAESPALNCVTGEESQFFFEKGKDRFLKEARILAKFSKAPGIVDVRDFFETNNTAYIIMEYLDGETLKHYLGRRGTMSPEQAVELLMPVMLSLKNVHRAGLIHRDISPDNIMLVDGQVKLLDFGAARDVSGSGNRSLSVMLKPGYAPEEQYRSKGRQGPWTDVYALCATLYKCITGITPDDAPQRVLEDELKAPSSLGIRINAVVENAIMKGLSVIQKDRYQSVDELIEDLKGSGNQGRDSTCESTANAISSEYCPEYPETDEAEEDEDRTVFNDTRAERTEEEPLYMPVGEARIDEEAGQKQKKKKPRREASAPETSQVSVKTDKRDEPVKKHGRRRTKKIGIIIVCAILAVAAVAAVITAVKAFSVKTIAGERINKNVVQLSISDENLTVEDLKVLPSLGKLEKVSFYRCSIDNEAFKYIGDIKTEFKSLILDECTGVTDYSPISNLKYLTMLVLTGCDLTDEQLSGIQFEKIDRLQEVRLSYNEKLTDLTPLSVCSRLSTLKAEACGLTSLPSITNCTVMFLEVSDNKITDIAALSEYEALYLFEANNNKITDISSLADKPSLYDVYLDGNSIADISPLSSVKWLSTLSINDNEVGSLLPLSDCEQLRELCVSRNKLTSLDGLQHALLLKHIEAEGNSISSLDGLENCTVLETVNLNGNHDIEDMSILAKSAKTLTRVTFNDNKVTDLSALAGTAALKYLSFDHNSVDSLEPLQQSSSLYAISADGNLITSLAGIENMTKLRYIFLPHNQISDVSALAELGTKAEENFLAIDLSSNSISEFSLSSAKEYRYLAVYNNPIQSLNAVTQIGGDYFLFSYLDGADYSAIGSSFSYFKVVDCPLDRQVEVKEHLGYFTSFQSVEEADQETEDILASVF